MQSFQQSSFYLPLVFTAVIFGIAPILLRLIGLQSITYRRCVQSFLAGLLLAFFYRIMTVLPLIGGIVSGLLVFYLFLNVAFASLGIIVGVLQGIFHRKWTKLTHALKLLGGHFYLSGRRGFCAGLWEGISRHSWELPQNLIGHIWAQSLNTFGFIQRVDYFDGATFSTSEKQSKRSGMSLSTFIYIAIDDAINVEFRQKLLTDPLLMHEFGHSFDSKIYGLFYLPLIGLPSLISAARSKQLKADAINPKPHRFQTYEMRANRHAAYYFASYYQVDWAKFEKVFPLKIS
jgi:hypothetical protein